MKRLSTFWLINHQRKKVFLPNVEQLRETIFFVWYFNNLSRNHLQNLRDILKETQKRSRHCLLPLLNVSADNGVVLAKTYSV